jgi:hypothetical protein
MQLTSIADLEVPGALALEGLAQELTKLYDNFLDDFSDNGEDREPGIHATELNTCLRQVVYTLHSTKKVGSVERMWRKKFEVGHALHDMLQTHFAMMADRSNGRFTFEKEVRCQDTPLGQELCLASSCDGLFTFYERDYPILRVSTELKSKSPKEYEKLKKPEKKHVEQSHLYMACLDVPLTWTLYWDKGTEHYTPSLTPYLFRFDKQIWSGLEARARTALQYAERGQLPEPEVGMHCQWCPYSYTCNPPNERHNRVMMPIKR